jgi:hypothetical protein
MLVEGMVWGEEEGGKRGKGTYAVSVFSGPCSSSRWTAVEKRFQKAGSRIPAMVVVERL